jgi:transposase-like protein
MKAKILDKDKIVELYVDKGMSLDEVAEILSVSRSTLSRKMLYFGIHTRTISESKTGKPSGKKGALLKESDIDKEAIYKAYFEDMSSLRELELKFSITFKTLKKLFAKWGWEVRDHKVQLTHHNQTKKKGKNHGKQNKNYHYIYVKVAFEHYPAKCHICGYDKHREVLEVHHIDEDRSNNEPDNLRLLCPTCHREITLGVRPNFPKRLPTKKIKG